jgi:hypothetical protein
MSTNGQESPSEAIAVAATAKARRASHPAYVTCLILALATTLGVIWGQQRIPLPLFPLTHLAGLASLGLMGIGCVVSWRDPKRRPMAWSLMVLAYAAFLFISDPFLFRGGEAAMFAIMLLLPLLLSIGPCVRSGNPASAWGVALFLATAMAILIHNSRASSFGIGFSGGWVA